MIFIIQEITDHLSINRSYLHRLFKSVTGTSIQNYLLDYRVRLACLLLKTTDLSVRSIAHTTGKRKNSPILMIFKRLTCCLKNNSCTSNIHYAIIIL